MSILSIVALLGILILIFYFILSPKKPELNSSEEDLVEKCCDNQETCVNESCNLEDLKAKELENKVKTLKAQKDQALLSVKHDKNKCYVYATKHGLNYLTEGYYVSLNSFYQANKDSIMIKKSNFYRLWKVRSAQGYDVFRFKNSGIFCTLATYEKLVKKL